MVRVIYAAGPDPRETEYRDIKAQSHPSSSEEEKIKQTSNIQPTYTNTRNREYGNKN